MRTPFPAHVNYYIIYIKNIPSSFYLNSPVRHYAVAYVFGGLRGQKLPSGFRNPLNTFIVANGKLKKKKFPVTRFLFFFYLFIYSVIIIIIILFFRAFNNPAPSPPCNRPLGKILSRKFDRKK